MSIATRRLLPTDALPLFDAYAAEMRGLLHGRAAARAAEAAALIAAAPAATLLGAFAGDAPIGFLVLLELPEIVFARCCGQIEDLFVLPAYRGRGAARALVAAAEAEGRARTWSHIRWFVPEGDMAAIALYDRIAARTDWRAYILRLEPDASL
ncbi:GNAT family N-acetyltransferase [Roseomonas hellenica]|uniref:GNAT family N-acetyltransferase n=1 Tax=Plastoroseomonas hellenica TaxID=2687306 RepID=A0ABS5EZR3_9PROT|nr:GNAT family N-acetyltransferase [Plastoroseomonas hellenica]MBR0665767.1 GNAT family N-acetyltransferase [Plastoroseomonas hellenica]